MCCTKTPCKIVLHWQFHLKSEISKEKWQCFHARLSALIQFWVRHFRYIYSTEVCYTVSFSIHLLRRPRYCLHDAIDWLFNASFLCLTTLQPQFSSQTYIHTYAHKAQREECGICPGLRAKTRGPYRSQQQPASRARWGPWQASWFSWEMLIISTRVRLWTPSKNTISPEKWPGP